MDIRVSITAQGVGAEIVGKKKENIGFGRLGVEVLTKKKAKKQKKAMKKKKKKKSGAQRAKAAGDKGDHEAAAKIRFGKKGSVALWKASWKTYREKPANIARKKVLNKKNNKKQSVKAQKKSYDQSDAAKEKRRAREKKKQKQRQQQSRAALAWQ